MPIRLSKRMDTVAPSATKAMTARARALKAQGRDIIALTQGEPDFDTPAPIGKAGMAAIAEGRTRYTAVPGIPELRQAIADQIGRDHGLARTTDEIIVCSGAKQVIANALLATLDTDDEVIVPAPCWVTYPEVVKLAGGTPMIVDCTDSPTFKLTAEALETAITSRTRWLILNTPSNPTGAVYTARELEAFADVLRGHEHVAVLTDEIYAELVYPPARFASLAAIAPDLSSRILIVGGVSKAHAMTGWRIGWGAGPADLVKAMATLQGQTTSHASSIAQYAALQAVSGDQGHLADFRATLRKRRDLLCERIGAMPGLSCRVPDGTFYVLVDCTGLLGRRTVQGTELGTDIDIAMWLLEQFDLAVVPGSSFLGPGHLRLSYAVSTDDLERACNRLQAACDALMREAA